MKIKIVLDIELSLAGIINIQIGNTAKPVYKTDYACGQDMQKMKKE